MHRSACTDAKSNASTLLTHGLGLDGPTVDHHVNEWKPWGPRTFFPIPSPVGWKTFSAVSKGLECH